MRVCGICGVVQLRGEPGPVIESAVLDVMTDVMTHRGPDDRGTHVDDGIAIGVRRLSIVDVEGGHQPVSNEDGTIWAAQNGELYNHEALRATLATEGHAFRSRCDTEVLPHLYERWGADLPMDGCGTAQSPPRALRSLLGTPRAGARRWSRAIRLTPA